MPLVIKQRETSGVVILDLMGRLWILDLPLRELMNSLLADGKRQFVINLTGVDYIDSSGLGQLITIWTSIRNKGGHMTVLSPSKRVQRLLEITRLNTVFQILEKEGEAVDIVIKSSATAP
jgi:anti-sigma B factor antagonist